MKTDYSLSIVIACYKDAGSIHEFYNQLSDILPGVTREYEIIYVNDASPDNAEEILREIAAQDHHVVVVNHTRNFGSQNAFLSGMAVARGDAVVLMDGDLQDPPAVIPDLIAKWREGYDIVYGVRVKRAGSFFRRVSYKLFYRIFRGLADFDLPLDAGDFGLLDRKVIHCLLEDFPEHSVFLRGLRAYTGFKHTGVDYARAPRYYGKSTNSLLRNISWAKFAILSFSKKPLNYISLMALLALFITFCLSIYYLLSYFIRGGTPSGFMTLLLVTIFVGSVQLLCFSVLAEYMGHIYEEVKRRPRFIVRDIIDNRDKAESSEAEADPKQES